MHIQVLPGNVQVSRTRAGEIYRGREAQSTRGSFPSRVISTAETGPVPRAYG